MCFVKDEITQLEHLFIVLCFSGILFILASEECQHVIKNIQKHIDEMLGFTTPHQQEHHHSPLKTKIQYWCRTLGVWIQNDYKSSQIRRVIRRCKRYIHNKFLY